MKAIWNDAVIAESNDTIVVENRHYFPADSVNMDYLVPSDTTSTCPWKGAANYYSLHIADKFNPDAAWYYAQPKDNARAIKGRIAFWKGVRIIP